MIFMVESCPKQRHWEITEYYYRFLSDYSEGWNYLYRLRSRLYLFILNTLYYTRYISLI